MSDGGRGAYTWRQNWSGRRLLVLAFLHSGLLRRHFCFGRICVLLRLAASPRFLRFHRLCFVLSSKGLQFYLLDRLILAAFRSILKKADIVIVWWRKSSSKSTLVFASNLRESDCFASFDFDSLSCDSSFRAEVETDFGRVDVDRGWPNGCKLIPFQELYCHDNSESRWSLENFQSRNWNFDPSLVLNIWKKQDVTLYCSRHDRLQGWAGRVSAKSIIWNNCTKTQRMEEHNG